MGKPITGTFKLHSTKKNSVRFEDSAQNAGLPSGYVGAGALRTAGFDPTKPPKRGRYTLEFFDDDENETLK